MLNKAFIICVIAALLCGMAPMNSTSTEPPTSSADISAIIERFRRDIQQNMQQEGTSGLAIAIVDDQSVLWSEGFGYTDTSQRTPITPDTLFSLQSMSKSFTVTAAMFAAQDGLVDLDEPITDYLPDFTVNSIFEKHPEQKITLRMLLSHTAGFAQEAPYGGNFDHPAYSFEKHIASISDTWLKFPVGSYYSYSNLGIDLAGYILQVKSGMPFIQYIQEKIFQPLGMKSSTLDVNQVRADATRAIGHIDVFPNPVDFLIIPSGGVWSTATDMARYLQFHINEGAIDGQRLLEQNMAETMYTPPNMAAKLSDYALGITESERNGARHFQHGGGGFGFSDSMVWYPDLKLGSVVLSNADQYSTYAYNLSEDILDAIIASSPEVYAQRAQDANPVAPAYPPIYDEVPLAGSQLNSLIKSKALPDDAAAVSRRSAYAGEYLLINTGFPMDVVEVYDTNGKLSDTYLGETAALTEVEPGLFFTPNGTTIDLRSPDMLFANIHGIKITSAALISHQVLYLICGLLFLSMLLLWPIRARMRSARWKKESTAPAEDTKNSAWLAPAAGLMALASLLSLVCIVLVVIVPYMIYLPWPHPFTEMNLWQHVLLYLPYISMAVALIAAVLAGVAYKRRGLTPSLGRYMGATLLACLVFNVVLLI
jgi:CubicO group peptidase (beta-lactamase class C family)